MLLVAMCAKSLWWSGCPCCSLLGRCSRRERGCGRCCRRCGLGSVVVWFLAEALHYTLLLLLLRDGVERLDRFLGCVSNVVFHGGEKCVNSPGAALAEVVVAILYPLCDHLLQAVKHVDYHQFRC
jgi:hypothetical protein